SPAIEELKARFRAERERLIDRVTKGEATARELELAHAYASQKADNAAAVREAESAAQELLKRRELDLDRLSGEIRNAMLMARKEIDNTISPDRIQMTLVERSLPAIAEAFAQQFAEARFTQIGGEGGEPSAMVARSIAQIIEVARGMGLRLGD
ncbi:MAG: hypothetical protein AAGC55_12800, partial [Myxococcota bacterium]